MENDNFNNETLELLVYLTPTEMLVVTSMRESTEAGKALIINASKASTKKPKAPTINLID